MKMNSNNVVIDELIIDGFKSYGKKTIFSNLDENFNAMTGINGSGKSNVLDSICFVLGLSNLSIIRAFRLRDLIYKNENCGKKFAFVSIVLKFKNFLEKLVNSNTSKKFIITRKIMTNGKTKYLLNNENVTPNRILNFFHSIGININNPHFFVRQGHIVKIVHMKPHQLLNTVENAFGMNLYDTKKRTALQTIQKKKEKVYEIGKMLIEKIKPHLTSISKSSFYCQKLKNVRSTTDKWVFLFLFSKLSFLKLKLFTYSFANKQIYGCTNIYYKKKILLTRMVEKTFVKKIILLHVLITFEKSFPLIIKKNIRTKINLEIISYLFYKKRLKSYKLEKINFNLLKGEKTKHEKNFIKIFKEKIKNNNDFRSTKMLIKSKINSKKNYFNLLKTIKILVFVYNFSYGFVWCNFFSKIYINRCSSYNVSLTKENFYRKKMFGSIRRKLKKVKILKSTKFKGEIIFSNMKIWKNFEKKLSFFLDPLFTKKKQTLWSLRFSIFGIIGSLIKIKASFLTTAVEFSGIAKLWLILVQNDAFSKKILEQGIFTKKITIFPLNKIYKFISDGGKNSLFTCLTNCFSNKSNLLGSTRYIFGEMNVICNLDQSEINLFSPEKKVRCITLDGDIFDSSGMMIAGKDKNFGFCAFGILSESNNQRSWLNRTGTIKYRRGGNEVFSNSIASIKNSTVVKRRKFFTFQGDKSKNKTFINLLFFFYRKKKKCSLNFYSKFEKKKFTTDESLIIFFPEKLYRKKLEKDFNPFVDLGNKISKKKGTLLKNLVIIYFYSEKSIKINIYSNKCLFLIKKEYKNIFLFQEKLYFLLILNLIYFEKIIIGFIALFLLKNRVHISRIRILFISNNSNIKNRIFPIKKTLKKENLKIPLCFIELNSILNIAKFQFNVCKKKISICSNLNFNEPKRLLDYDGLDYLTQGSNHYRSLTKKRALIEKDRLVIQEIISKLDKKKHKTIIQAIEKINSVFRAIFSILLPKSLAKLVLICTKKKKLRGIDFRIVLGQNVPKNINELSGGQKSLLALSFIFSVLLTKPAPFYILDEIDAALDLCHTQNIGKLIRMYFPMSQFIIVSLKNGIIMNANVIFKIKIVLGKSSVIRLQNK